MGEFSGPGRSHAPHHGLIEIENGGIGTMRACADNKTANTQMMLMLMKVSYTRYEEEN